MKSKYEGEYDDLKEEYEGYEFGEGESQEEIREDSRWVLEAFIGFRAVGRGREVGLGVVQDLDTVEEEDVSHRSDRNSLLKKDSIEVTDKEQLSGGSLVV